MRWQRLDPHAPSPPSNNGQSGRDDVVPAAATAGKLPAAGAPTDGRSSAVGLVKTVIRKLVLAAVLTATLTAVIEPAAVGEALQALGLQPTPSPRQYGEVLPTSPE